MRKCTTCKEQKPLDSFNKSFRLKDGRSYICKSCMKQYGIERRNKIRAIKMQDVPVGYKKCFTCESVKPKTEFYSNKAKSNGVMGSCIYCVKAKAVYPKSSQFEILYLEQQIIAEEWKAIKIDNYTYPYKISDCGRVLINRTGQIAKPSFDQRGYPQVVLTSNGKRISRRLHILVGEAFLENPNNLPELNHLDGNKLYPHKSNLEYSTHKGNIHHAFANGLNKPFTPYNHPRSKRVLDTETGKVYPSIRFVTNLFSIAKNTLHPKLNGSRKNDTKFVYYD